MNKHAAIGLAVFALLLLMAALYDSVRARSIEIEVVGIEPATVYADPNQPVTLNLRVSKSGEPAAGHDITGLVIGRGNLRIDRIKTDASGEVSFLYFPYAYMQGVQEAGKVAIQFRDISDSIFVAIQQPMEVELDVQKPDRLIGSKHNMNDMFGE